MDNTEPYLQITVFKTRQQNNNTTEFGKLDLGGKARGKA